MSFRIAWLRWSCILLCSLFGTACDDETRTLPPDLQEIRRKEPLSESFDVDYQYSDSARLKARLRAPHDLERYTQVAPDTGKQLANVPTLDRAPQTVHEMDRGFTLEFFSPAGQLESRIVAKRGMLYQQQGLAEAYGDVVVTNVKGEKLETQKLVWSRERDQIYTDAAVTITTAKEVLYGQGLESNTAFTRYRILKLKGTLSLDE